MWQAQTKLLGLVFVLGGLLSVTAMSAGGVEANLHGENAVAGVYELVAAAGRDLPAVVSEDSTTGYKQEIIGGSVTLRENRAFHWTTQYRYTEGSKVTISESSGGGAYKVEGDDITLSEHLGSSKLTGKLKGRSLSLKADVELVYKKE
ncbi:MAG: hypothetical protein L0387_37370 [Acidobacteria bacterium]|nr:hypothetical protein [Acidobacteriota bacterium]MCI0627258.1 hypothetical protein [Acidobacteriota bacterium]MCI0723679.1 hypothetical protein [Acidobacteriota bacterium]